MSKVSHLRAVRRPAGIAHPHILRDLHLGSLTCFIIEQIIGQLDPNIIPYFYRTSAGAEIDIVLTKANKPFISIEVKRTLSPKVTKSFRNAINDLKTKNNFIIYPGNESYPIAKDIKVISFNELNYSKWL